MNYYRQFSLYIERCRFLCIFRRMKGRKNIILVDYLLQIQIPVYMLVMTLEFKPALLLLLFADCFCV